MHDLRFAGGDVRLLDQVPLRLVIRKRDAVPKPGTQYGEEAMTTPETVPVTQADREASANFIEDYWDGDPEMEKLARSYRNGHSQGAFTRHFARHRLAAVRDLEAQLAEIQIAYEHERQLRLEVIAQHVATLAQLAEARGLLEAVYSEMNDGRDAPGHSHQKKGVWDSGNPPELSGRPCNWCETWDKARAFLSRTGGEG